MSEQNTIVNKVLQGPPCLSPTPPSTLSRSPTSPNSPSQSLLLDESNLSNTEPSEANMRALAYRAHAAEAEIARLKQKLNERHQTQTEQPRSQLLESRLEGVKEAVKHLFEKNRPDFHAYKGTSSDKDCCADINQIISKLDNSDCRKALLIAKQRITDLEANLCIVCQDNQDLETSLAGAEARIGILMEQIESLQSRLDASHECYEQQAVVNQELKQHLSAALARNGNSQAQHGCSTETNLLSRNATATTSHLLSENHTIQNTNAETNNFIEITSHPTSSLPAATDFPFHADGENTEELASDPSGRDDRAPSTVHEPAVTRTETDHSNRSCFNMTIESNNVSSPQKVKMKGRHTIVDTRGSYDWTSRNNAFPTALLKFKRGPELKETHELVMEILQNAGLSEEDFTYYAPLKYRFCGEQHIINIRQVGTSILVSLFSQGFLFLV